MMRRSKPLVLRRQRPTGASLSGRFLAHRWRNRTSNNIIISSKHSSSSTISVHMSSLMAGVLIRSINLAWPYVNIHIHTMWIILYILLRYSHPSKAKVMQTIWIYFSVGTYADSVDCDMTPMQACSLLLDHPYKYDNDMLNYGRSNKIFLHDDKGRTKNENKSLMIFWNSAINIHSKPLKEEDKSSLSGFELKSRCLKFCS